MSGYFKIYVALLISAAFIFRVLFVNIGLISSLSSQQNNSFLKSHLSSAMKRKKQFEVLNANGGTPYSVVEVCEEDTDHDNEIKSKPFFLIQILYSLFGNHTGDNPTKIAPLSGHFSKSIAQKYIAFQVFRIWFFLPPPGKSEFP